MPPERNSLTSEIAREFGHGFLLGLLLSPSFISGLVMLACLGYVGYSVLGVLGAAVGAVLGFTAGFLGAFVVRHML
jgi:Na+-driven multidrug efflux pump